MTNGEFEIKNIMSTGTDNLPPNLTTPPSAEEKQGVLKLINYHWQKFLAKFSALEAEEKQVAKDLEKINQAHELQKVRSKIDNLKP